MLDSNDTIMCEDDMYLLKETYPLPTSLPLLLRFRRAQVSTVDAFQGAEKDIVVVASTRTERLGFIVR